MTDRDGQLCGAHAGAPQQAGAVRIGSSNHAINVGKAFGPPAALSERRVYPIAWPSPSTSRTSVLVKAETAQEIDIAQEIDMIGGPL
jgi:hypothetical protein